jgi:CRP/FNR family cyclic AMP-dependent transcriptional regulator
MLKKIDLFAELSDGAAESLLRYARSHKYPKHSVVVSEGDAQTHFYIVESGCLKVFVDGEGGRQFTLNWLGSGDYFGELALIDGGPRSASVMTVTPTELRVISQHDFQHFLQQESGAALALALMKALARRIRVLTGSVRDMALLDVYGRVASVLQQRAAASGRIEPKLTHQEIADMVGASREMVSRIMRELTVGGYIEQAAGALILHKALPKGW